MRLAPFVVTAVLSVAPSLAAPPTAADAGAPPGVLSDLDANHAAEVARQLADLGPVGANDDVVGHIDIPRVGISADILEGVDDATIRRAVGHFPETPWPGEGGNVALAAHRTTHFRPLREIEEGDRITLTHAGSSTVYEVEATWVVDPKAVWVLARSAAPELTLVTCYPFDYDGHAPERFIVRARAVSGPVKSGVDTGAPGPAE